MRVPSSANNLEMTRTRKAAIESMVRHAIGSGNSINSRHDGFQTGRDPVQILGVAYEEQAVRKKMTQQAVHYFLFGLPVKVNENVAAEDQVEAGAKGIRTSV